MPMTPDEAKKLFYPLFPVFWAAVRRAFARYFEVNQLELGAIHDRTKSSYINDLVIKYLKELLPKEMEAKWENKRWQRRVWLCGVACFRFKKVNQNLQPHNLATQAQFDFYDSLIKPQTELPNITLGTPLFLGYTVNRTKTAPENLFLIHADGVLNHRSIGKIESIKPKIIWAIPIPSDKNELPSTSQAPLNLPEKPRSSKVKVKDELKKKFKKGE